MIIERDEPLAAIIDSVVSLRCGAGGIVLVSGEAGIGKTTLLTEFRGLIGEGVKLAWGGCDALYTPSPLAPLAEMARILDGEIVRLLAEEAKRPVLFQAVIDAIQNAPAPTILVFEDIHWADHATIDLLRFLGRRINALSALLVLSFRRDEIEKEHPLTVLLGELSPARTKRIELQGLSRTGVESLAKIAGRSGEGIFEITGGNPFFVTELLASDNLGGSDVPTSIKDAVGAKLARLDRREREGLELTSVAPFALDRRLLRELLRENADDIIAKCVARNFIVQDKDGSVRFRHELARLAVLARLSASEQTKIHANILKVLLTMDREGDLARIVHHAAGALDAKQVLAAAPRAARRAAALGAHREAAAHLATALRFVAEAEPELAARLYEDWAYEAGLALRIDEDVLEARRHAVTIWRALGRTDKVGENLRWLSRLHWYRGEASEAIQFADEAIRTLEAAPASRELAMAYSVRSQLHMLNDRMDEAVLWGNRALALAEKFDDVEVRVHALNNVGTALAFRIGDAGAKMLEESLALAIDRGFHEHAARVYTNLSEYLITSKQFGRADDVLSKGIAFDTRHDLDSWTNYLIGRQAQLRLEQGRLSEAVMIARGVLALDNLTLVMRLPALTVLAKARSRQGEGDARELLAAALEQAMATGEPQNITPVRFALIEAAWLSGKSSAAADHMNSLSAVDLAALDPWQMGELAIWSCRFGVQAGALAHEELPQPFQLELSGRFAEAGAAWGRLGLPFEAGAALLQAGENASFEDLQCAFKHFADIGAAPGVKKVRDLANRLGMLDRLPRPRRGPYSKARQNQLGLTRREQEVLVLLVGGANNRQIADRLVRSERTIEHHVSSILTKLNAANRVEAVLRIHNQPWLLQSLAKPAESGG